MKAYRYRAKKRPGEIVEGTLFAETQDDAVDQVNGMGLVPVEIREAAAQTEEPLNRKKGRWRRTSSRDLLAFYRQMSKLTGSGVPLLQALFLAAQGHDNPAFIDLVGKLHKEIRQGQTFSSALALHPKTFSAFDVGMVQTGEAAGRLEEVLSSLADYREKQRLLASKVRGALAYPAVVFLMGLLTVGFMLSHVIPKFSAFFADLGQELPLITRGLIALSLWMERYGIWVLIGTAAILSAPFVLRKRTAWRLRFDAYVLAIPVAGKVLLKAEVARTARTLEMLIRSGIPVLKALRITVPVCSNLRLRQDVEVCRDLVEQGGTLSEGLRRSSLFPAFARHFIGIGEESGRLEEALREIADWYEKDTEEAVKVMTSLLEPLMILIIGGTLGILIIAVLLPVFSMNTMAS
ncbi:MAG: type II secretion system F family protein [Candidatus Omnitrophica bacterium]|nr:type II secretion system F family protein [Candidatus Omnitrophota bacterium]